MISKNQIKYIHSLETKKGRNKENAFVAEGPKVVADLMAFMQPQMIVATEEWYRANPTVSNGNGCFVVTEDELRKVSFLQHPQQVLAVFPIKDKQKEAVVEKKLYLALDGVQDPGNLGTIIRIADWFGINTIVCSPDTADAFNPKVVQATMGSIARVKIAYTPLAAFIKSLPTTYPVYATLLDGDNIYETTLSQHGLIVMGNEGNGISQEVRQCISNKLLIPTFATSPDKADSLNVAIATAIVCSEFRRNR